MKKMKFLFAALAIVFAAGSAFTPAKKKAVDEKKWFQLLSPSADPSMVGSYQLSNFNTAYEGEDIGCPSVHSSAVCAIYAEPVLVGSDYRPNSTDLSNIVSASNSFQQQVEDGSLQYVEDEE